uniref:Uncharacterized protein n=1 Tax=Anas platyrhynchos platyrhynchos TaxID=8840 RepID=A0A493TMR6_ANAPP
MRWGLRPHVSPSQTSTRAPRTASSARTTAASPTAGSATVTTTVGTTRTSPTPPARVRSLADPQGGHVRGSLLPTLQRVWRLCLAGDPLEFVPHLSPSTPRHCQLL